MENKVCSCCKNVIFANSINADELYVIRTEWYNYHKDLDEYDLIKEEYILDISSKERG